MSGVMDGPFVFVHPGFKFGYPSVGWDGGPHRLSCEEVAEWWWDGLRSLDDLTEDYDIPRDAVLMACWFQSRYGTLRWRKRWGEWQTTYTVPLWESRWASVPMPPQVPKP